MHCSCNFSISSIISKQKNWKEHECDYDSHKNIHSGLAAAYLSNLIFIHPKVPWAFVIPPALTVFPDHSLFFVPLQAIYPFFCLKCLYNMFSAWKPSNHPQYSAVTYTSWWSRLGHWSWATTLHSGSLGLNTWLYALSLSHIRQVIFCSKLQSSHMWNIYIMKYTYMSIIMYY